MTPAQVKVLAEARAWSWRADVQDRALREAAEQAEKEATRCSPYLESKIPEAKARGDQRRREAAAHAELYRRGADPEHPRRFPGTISLTVRCEPRGHELAHVYPTKHGPVFVPTASRPREGARPASAAIRQVKEAFPWVSMRDEWVVTEWVVTEGEDDVQTARIGNMTCVDPQKWAALPPATSFFLNCRCGTRAAPLAMIAQALSQATRRLTV